MEEIKNLKVSEKLIIRSSTNDGELAKQYFTVAEADNKEPVLIIDKLILTNKNFKDYIEYGFIELKELNGYKLFIQNFSIKLKTLHEVGGWLNYIMTYE